MKDTYSEAIRSRVMRSVRAENTKPEMAVRSALHRAGYRFRVHRSDLPGKPDIVLPRYRTVLFVNGCFWHQHSGCRKATIPVNNRAFWERKLERTVQRDVESRERLADLGWKSIIVWECEIRKSMETTMDKVFSQLRRNVKDGKGKARR